MGTSLGMSYKDYAILTEGKTKIIRQGGHYPMLVILEAKDDITAGNGTRHDVIEGKAAYATTTTCNVFRLLKECGIPVAFREQLDATRFLKDDLKPFTLTQRNLDSVIIAYAGRSNGLGPALAANTTIPVITVPASVKDFPHDVWSSLRMPSEAPCMTI